jgi:hypothetical protein
VTTKIEKGWLKFIPNSNLETAHPQVKHGKNDNDEVVSVLSTEKKTF